MTSPSVTPPAKPGLNALLWASYRAWWGDFSMRLRSAPPGPRWWQLVWTGVFCLQVAVVITALAWLFSGGDSAVWRGFFNNFQLSLSVGYIIHGLFEAAGRVLLRLRLDPKQFKPYNRAAFFIGIPMLGTALGAALFLTLKGYNPLALLLRYPAGVLTSLAISMLVSVFLFIVWRVREHRLDLQRQAAEAQLKALQAQIEPHFLFNTLANVVSLIDYDAPLAKAMLEAFVAYLRATLDANRKPQATVGDELAIVERYLQLLKVRMGERLHYAIVADEAARALALPPLTLQPLVENAIKHGLEPKVGPGGVSITARLTGDALLLTVLDSGVGLQAAAPGARKGNGLALHNIRERLASLYGAQASLQLEDAAPQGTLATVRIARQALAAHEPSEAPA